MRLLLTTHPDPVPVKQFFNILKRRNSFDIVGRFQWSPTRNTRNGINPHKWLCTQLLKNRTYYQNTNKYRTILMIPVGTNTRERNRRRLLRHAHWED